MSLRFIKMSVDYFRNPLANIHFFLKITIILNKKFTELFIIRKFCMSLFQVCFDATDVIKSFLEIASKVLLSSHIMRNFVTSFTDL